MTKRDKVASGDVAKRLDKNKRRESYIDRIRTKLVTSSASSPL